MVGYEDLLASLVVGQLPYFGIYALRVVTFLVELCNHEGGSGPLKEAVKREESMDIDHGSTTEGAIGKTATHIFCAVLTRVRLAVTLPTTHYLTLCYHQPAQRNSHSQPGHDRERVHTE
mgnify:CR=1 FL=1